MKKRNFAFLICCMVLSAVAAWSHFAWAGIENPPVCDTLFAGLIDPPPVTAAGGTGLNFSFGFEPGEGFVLAYISNGGGTPAGCGGVAFPCWGHTSAGNASLITPSIENLHPASGLQHMRLTHDPTTRTNITGFGLGVDARYPRTADLSIQPVARSTVSADIAISAAGGMDYRIQPQSNSQGCIQSSTLFFYTGAIYVLDDLCGTTGLNFQPIGVDWDTTGAYQPFMTMMNPFAHTLNYYYGGTLIYASCPYFGSNVEQFLVFGDNYPGSYMDVDNVAVSTFPPICGDGLLEEICEPTNDSNCPGRCIPPGQPGECSCTPICTHDDPCPVVNGPNGPFLTSNGFYVYSGDSPFVSVDGCGTDFDFRATLRLGTVEEVLLSNNGCSPIAANHDTSASCFSQSGNQLDPCACIANPGQPILIQLSSSSGYVPPGSLSIINIRKKAACAGASVGSCCDTNGLDQGCTDNLAEADCTGADKVWTDQGTCAGMPCDCIADCTGRICGDDGCGGSCGTCGDGNACNGSEVCNSKGQCGPGAPLICNDGNPCNGIESCETSVGCVLGTPLQCDDGLFCDGEEFCVPVFGCQAGNPPCTENETCDEDTDQCVPSSIPTVSQWGLVALTLLLLIAAKAKFRHVRRMI